VGAYIGLTADECSRAVGMMLRWRSGAWKKKGLIED
jgi:Na+-driven multidrug efflux pump